MVGAIYSILAGIFISLQSVFNTRVSEKIGMFQTVTVVHVVGLLTAIFFYLFSKEGSFSKLGEVNKLYLLGGAFGVIIVYGVIKGVSILGPTLAISILLIAQLLVALAIDTFGLFGSAKIPFDFTKPLGVAIMIAGIIVFKLR